MEAPNGIEEIIEEGEVTAWRWIKQHQMRKPRKRLPIVEPIKTGISELPDWLGQADNREASVLPPLYPSAAAANVEAKPAAPGLTSVAPSVVENFAIERGNATHHLLQFLPEIEPVLCRQRGDAYLQKSYPDWNKDQMDDVASEVIAILEDNRFKELFSQQSRAEVSLVGTLDPGGLNRPVSGQIDRIAVLADRVMIVDYKSDRFIPTGAENITSQYLVQLAIYRQLVGQIITDKPVKFALLWTGGPKLMEIDDELLTANLAAWIKKSKHSGVKA